MAEPKQGEKTLEMRVAELEDKLKGMQVTEEEMRAYNKVAALMGGAPQAGAGAGQALAGPAPIPADCVVAQCIRSCTIVSQCVRPCTIVSQCIRSCTIVSQCIRACTIIQDCINECGGGFGGGGIGGGGFGTLGG
jgi:hypothetical protein